MKEVARGEISSEAPPFTRVLVRADGADTCARVAFLAGPPVHASLTDARGDILADVPSTTDTPLGTRGPVCVRRGDTITLNVSNASNPNGSVWLARFVAWSSP
jgi:hypothetical protein